MLPVGFGDGFGPRGAGGKELRMELRKDGPPFQPLHDLNVVSDHNSLSVHYSLPSAPVAVPTPPRWSTADADWERFNFNAHHAFSRNSLQLRRLAQSLQLSC